jgi:sugar-phosphatase
LFAAVVFDLDGTLIDSMPAVRRAWAAWAGEQGLAPEAVQGFEGQPAATIIAALLPGEARDAARRRINEIEIADVEGVVALPGAVEAQRRLASARTAIATSCTRPLAAVRIAAAGLAAPDVVVTVDDVARGKPAPDPFVEAARRLGVPASACLVVEDAVAGIEAGRAAGCATLALRTTARTAGAVAALEAAADAVVADLSAVVFRVGDDGAVEVMVAAKDAGSASLRPSH